MSIEIECAFWSSFKEKMGLSPKKCTFFETEHNVWGDFPKPMKILFIFQRGLKGSDEEKLGAPQEKRRTSRWPKFCWLIYPCFRNYSCNDKEVDVAGIGTKFIDLTTETKNS